MSWPNCRFIGGIPLGAHISQRIKEKIWNNEFMNYADLLPKLDFEDPWSVTLGPSLITTSKEKNFNVIFVMQKTTNLHWKIQIKC
jgi:hypothetical protein